MKVFDIGVDVDLVTVDSDVYMYKQLVSLCGLPQEPLVPPYKYDLGYYFRDRLKELNLDSMDFWRADDVYDNMLPRSDAKRVLDQLHAEGHKITFVTAIKGNHHKSKVAFLKHHFPYWDGILATKEKHKADVDILIDDRLKNFEKVKPHRHCIHFKTYYEQDSAGRGDEIVCTGWFEVKQAIDKLRAVSQEPIVAWFVGGPQQSHEIVTDKGLIEETIQKLGTRDGFDSDDYTATGLTAQQLGNLWLSAETELAKVKDSLNLGRVKLKRGKRLLDLARTLNRSAWVRCKLNKQIEDFIYDREVYNLHENTNTISRALP